MVNQESQKEIIDLLIQNELAMKDLYNYYGEHFRLYGEFWKEVAQEEQEHADWIKTLFAKVEFGEISLAEDRFPMESIRMGIELIEAEKEKAESGEITLIESLESALHIEKGMLENKFFEVFEGDSPALKNILDALRTGTEKHLEAVNVHLEKEKMGGDFEKETA